jgi:hypothetical protein
VRQGMTAAVGARSPPLRLGLQSAVVR